MKRNSFFKWIFLRVMGNKHTAGELTTFAFGTLPMRRDESLRNGPWSFAKCYQSNDFQSISTHVHAWGWGKALFQLFTVKWWDNWGNQKRPYCDAVWRNDISFLRRGVVVKICNVMLPASFYLNLKIFQPSKLRSIAFTIHLQNYFVLEILFLESFLQTILLNLKHKSHYKDFITDNII